MTSFRQKTLLAKSLQFEMTPTRRLGTIVAYETILSRNTPLGQSEVSKVQFGYRSGTINQPWLRRELVGALDEQVQKASRAERHPGHLGINGMQRQRRN